ncbi:NADP-dependent oxidoreductase [Rhodococcus spongiicola]|uniref:NADP-dependent oxidoreductase n=1 Tax=Rhodococcus spongiicola TaxID=2487352 RepID=A0A3S3DZI6_9NOCA|nr:NADP-dependent oxidoreductase [Rhodococcus spongiicola]RVW02487.1 NADP-dependent oxidoreductase [Rhodococcus spongiicola]
MGKTVVASAFGGPEVLEVIEEDLPAPGPGQVVVAMRAIGVNPVDYRLYSGEFGADPALLPVRPGMEGSGVVVEVGPDSEEVESEEVESEEADSGEGGSEHRGVRVGDEVIVYTGTGAYAERVLVSAQDVLLKPESVPWDSAACLLTAGGTAVDAVTAAGVGDGDVVVIFGAAGGVGEVAVQLAAAWGARVIGVAREKHHDFLRTLGAVPVAPGEGLSERIRRIAPRGVDAVIDTIGADEVVDDCLALGADLERVVTVVAFERAERDGFVAVGVGTKASDWSRPETRPILVDLAGRGLLDVFVGRRFPLTEAAEAHRALQQPHPRGKFVLVP